MPICEGHWYPERPCKGSGFRCVRVNGENLDPVMINATFECGLNLEEVKSYLPPIMTSDVLCNLNEIVVGASLYLKNSIATH
jgi:hypothetical protein